MKQFRIKKILLFNCFFTSFLMLVYSVLDLVIKVKCSFNELFIYIILCYLSVNLFVFSITLLVYKRKNKSSTSTSKKEIKFGKTDIFNFISLFFYLLANRDLLNHLASSPLHSKLGLLNFLLIFALINIENEF